jgi:hypothetical protein
MIEVQAPGGFHDGSVRFAATRMLEELTRTHDRRICICCGGCVPGKFSCFCANKAEEVDGGSRETSEIIAATFGANRCSPGPGLALASCCVYRGQAAMLCRSASLWILNFPFVAERWINNLASTLEYWPLTIQETRSHWDCMTTES